MTDSEFIEYMRRVRTCGSRDDFRKVRDSLLTIEARERELGMPNGYSVYLLIGYAEAAISDPDLDAVASCS